MSAKICVLTSVHEPFDQGIFHKQARTLAQVGYDVTLVAPADFAKQVRDGVRVLGLSRPSLRWGWPKVWWRLMRQVMRLRPDVIHFHDPELLLIVPLLRLALDRRVRIVYDVHEYLIDSIAHKVRTGPGALGWTRCRAHRRHFASALLCIACQGQGRRL